MISLHLQKILHFQQVALSGVPALRAALNISLHLRLLDQLQILFSVLPEYYMGQSSSISPGVVDADPPPRFRHHADRAEILRPEVGQYLRDYPPMITFVSQKRQHVHRLSAGIVRRSPGVVQRAGQGRITEVQPFRLDLGDGSEIGDGELAQLPVVR